MGMGSCGRQQGGTIEEGNWNLLFTRSVEAKLATLFQMNLMFRIMVNNYIEIR